MKTATTRRLSLAALVAAGLFQLQMLRAQNTTTVRTVVGSQVREQTVSHRGTSPAPDTDGDGYDDDQERALGTDPTDTTSKGAAGPTLLSRMTTTSYSAGGIFPGPGLAGFQTGTTANYKRLVVRQTVTEEVPPDLPADAWTPSIDLGTRTFIADYDPNNPAGWRISGQRLRLENYPDPGLISTFDMTRNWHSPASPPSGAVSDTVLRRNDQYVAHPRHLESVDIIIRIEIEWTLSEPSSPVQVPPGLVSETGSWIAGPVRAWRAGSDERIVDYVVVMPAETTSVVRWLEVFTPDGGTPAQVIARAWTVGAGETKSPPFTLSCPADGQAEVLLTPGTLRVDTSRDGVIALPSDEGVPLDPPVSAAQPFRFWSNSDDDSEDVNGSDIPGEGSSDFSTGIAGPPGLGSNFGVDGNRDLIDWFPVFLDIKQLITVLPPSTTVKYKLKHEGNALSFVYTNLTRERASSYQRERHVTGFGFNLDRAPGEAQSTHITAAGAALNEEFLTRIRDENAGVILIEAGAATDKPLVLTVEYKDGTMLTELKLELKISPVEEMYRRLNLRAGNDAPRSGLSGLRQDDGLPTSMSEPANFPDDATADSWLIFVHGYNVSGAAARGWNSESFKRFYWSRNKGRFVGVSWFGNPYGAEDDKVADYHLAVMNAFVTAPILAAKISPLIGRKTIVAHSLGCGIVSSAIHDAGLSVNDFCMIDAAMSMEAYKGDTTADVEGMALPQWVDGEGSSTPNYPRGAWASEWHRLFENTPADQRNGVTWRGRLNGVVAVAHNFYSRTEDVLARLPGTPPDGILSILWSQPGMLKGRYAWTVQEKTKGRRMDINVLVGHVRAGSDYGGWGFNLTDPAVSTDPIYYWSDGSALGGCKRAPLSSFPDPTTSLGRELYRRAPLFDPGYGPTTGCTRWYDPTRDLRGPSWLPSLFNEATGSVTAGDPNKRNQLLAQAFPALTQPVGANYTPAFSSARNHNMPEELLGPAGWPSARGQELVGGTPMARWLHSDMREVAYLYTHPLFDQIVTISEETP